MDPGIGIGNVVLLIGGDLVPVLALPSAPAVDDEVNNTPSPAPPWSVNIEVRAEFIPAPSPAVDVPGLVANAGVALAS